MTTTAYGPAATVTRNLDGPRLWLAGLGAGACIAATEVQRYTVLWPVGIGSTGDRYTSLLVYLLLGFAVLALASRTLRGRLYRGLPLLAILVAISAAGIAVRAFSAFDMVQPGPLLRVFVSFAMETPYFLMVVWASFLLECAPRDAMRAVALGIVVAGAAQMVVSLFLGHPVSYVLALLFAPVACAVLRRLDRETGETGTSPQAEMRMDGGQPPAVAPSSMRQGALADAGSRGGSAAFGVTCALIVSASLVVYIIHSQWTGVQDSGPASLLVQVCTGFGMLLAGGLLCVVAARLDRRSLFDFCFVLILPVAVAGLYLSETANGTTLAVSAVPLNIVYATLLFFVWSVPFICLSPLSASALSMLAFLLKRVGVVACPLVISLFAALGIELAWMTFAAIVLLIVLDVAHFLLVHGEDGLRGENAADDGKGDYARACREIAAAYRLTPREGETLALLGRGRTARYIAQELHMSDATVKTHIAHIYRKMGVNSQQSVLDAVEARATGGSAADRPRS